MIQKIPKTKTKNEYHAFVMRNITYHVLYVLRYIIYINVSLTDEYVSKSNINIMGIISVIIPF